MAKLPKLDWVRARQFRVGAVQPNPVPPAGWTAIAERLGAGELLLLGLWGEAGAAAMLLHDRQTQSVALARVKARSGAVPSVGRHHPAAQRPERAAADLTGLVFSDAPDTRKWLDHGPWDISRPLGKPAPDASGRPDAYAFLPTEGESLHQVPVGPVHAGVIEPGHFRFTAQGETVVRLEERLGYTHKGVEHLMQGASLSRGAELAGRISGDSTVAYAWAFAQAV